MINLKLLDEINWINMLWIHLLANKFDRMEHFFTFKERVYACRSSVIILKDKYPVLEKLGAITIKI